LYPPFLFQRAIADYLDRETARIDALITKKQRMVALLKERRKALIADAVTGESTSRGSGVKPWPTVQLRHAARCLDGGRIPLNAEQRAEMPGDYPYWGANGVVDSVGQYLFDETLVLLGEDGAPFGDRMKDVAFLVGGRVWVNNHIHVLRPTSRVDPRYLTYSLNAVDWPAFISGSTRDKLTQHDMNRVPVPCPPAATQRAIADYLDRETDRIDIITGTLERQIDLLRERRQALITAAVTGELEVSGVAA
jgi:type I restriction enzyme S subunit